MRIFTILLTATIIFNLFGCSGHTITNEEGRFSITFPGKPEYKKIPMDNTLYGESELHLYYYMTEDSTEIYQASYNELGTDHEIVKDSLFQDLITGPVMRLRPASIQTDTLDIPGGFGVRYELFGTGSATIYDIYLFDRSLYMLAIINRIPQPPSKAAIDGFMGSFRLLP